MRLKYASLIVAPLILFHASSVFALSYVDQRFKISGYWNGTEVVATRVQIKDASKDPRKGQINGTIARIDAARHILRIGPVTVAWSNSTRFKELKPGDLKVGKTIKVVGRLTGPGLMTAASFESGPRSLHRSTVQLIGAVTAGGRDTATTIKAKILGVPVHIPTKVFNRRQALIQRPDKRRPDDPITFVFFHRPLTIGGEIETTLRYRDNFDLDERDKDRLTRLDVEAKLDLFYPFTSSAAVFLEGKGTREQELRRDGRDRETESALERGETWLFLDRLFGRNLGLQIGRQNFFEEREWWWDEDLDGIRVHYNDYPWSAEVAVTKLLTRTSTAEDDIDPEEENVYRLLARTGWEWSRKQRLEVFFLRHEDRSGGAKIGTTVESDNEDENDATLNWLGLRAIGKPEPGRYGKVSYWMDTAIVWGDETVIDFQDIGNDVSRVSGVEDTRIRAWAADLGATWTMRLPGKPTFTLGYAYGSGDDDLNDRTDRAFRQTGLQDNENRFGGENRFRYYGELLRPELSNLKITTLSLGFQFLENSSFELAYHRYNQVEPAPFLRDARVDADLTGDNAEVGKELDLVFGIEEWKHLELEAVASVFTAGRAYGALVGARAHNFALKINYNF